VTPPSGPASRFRGSPLSPSPSSAARDSVFALATPFDPDNDDPGAALFFRIQPVSSHRTVATHGRTATEERLR